MSSKITEVRTLSSTGNPAEGIQRLTAPGPLYGLQPYHPLALIYLTFWGTYLRQGYSWDLGDIGRLSMQSFHSAYARLHKEFRSSGNKCAQRERSILLFELILLDYILRWSQLIIPVTCRLSGRKCPYGTCWGLTIHTKVLSPYRRCCYCSLRPCCNILPLSQNT